MSLEIRNTIKEDLDKLLSFLWESKFKKEKEGEFLEITKPLKKVAGFYEWLRNIIDIKEEHLLRRNAIFRILRREVILEGKKENLALSLLKELIAAGYLSNRSVLESEVPEFEKIIAKYLSVIKNYSFVEDRGKIDWWLSVASVEIDNKLSPDFYQKERLISSVILKRLKELISEAPRELSEKEIEILLYIGILKTVFKYDKAVLRERLIVYFIQDWEEVKNLDELEEKELEELKTFIENKLDSPYLVKFNRFVKNYVLIFWLFFDALEEALIISESFEEFKGEVLNNNKLKLIVERVYFQRLKKSKEKLARLTIRSVLFLLFTKTILALLFELPYDLYIERRKDFFPLIVNIFFHPLLLGTVAYSFKFKKPQLDLAKKGVEEMFFEVSKAEVVRGKKISSPRSEALENTLKLAWSTSFVVVFGSIIYLLVRLNFNIVSIFLFIFFLTLVSYLGWRARNIVNEVMIIQEKISFISLIIDFFSLPVIKIGEKLSTGLPNLNVFIFLMDFVVEAPFKALLKGLEEWLKFVREKKEEIQT